MGCKHIDVMLANSRVRVSGVADSALAAKRRVSEYGVPCYDTLDELLTTGLDALVIATPTQSHAAIALQAVSAEIPLLIEKPLAATREESVRMLAAFSAVKVPVLVGHHRRYYPVIETARQMIADGLIGQLIAVNGQWTTRKHDSYFEPDWRRKIEAGPVLTNLVHDLDTLRYICGDVISVQAHSASNRGFDKEDSVAIILQFLNGALGTFLLSDVAPSPWTWEFAVGESNYPKLPIRQNQLRIMGSEGALELPKLVKWTHTDSANHWHVPMHMEEISTATVDPFAVQCDHFCDVIEGRKSPRIDATDAARTLETTLAVLDAARTGERVELQRPQ